MQMTNTDAKFTNLPVQTSHYEVKASPMLPTLAGSRLQKPGSCLAYSLTVFSISRRLIIRLSRHTQKSSTVDITFYLYSEHSRKRTPWLPMRQYRLARTNVSSHPGCRYLHTKCCCEILQSRLAL